MLWSPACCKSPWARGGDRGWVQGGEVGSALTWPPLVSWGAHWLRILKHTHKYTRTHKGEGAVPGGVCPWVVRAPWVVTPRAVPRTVYGESGVHGLVPRGCAWGPGAASSAL